VESLFRHRWRKLEIFLTPLVWLGCLLSGWKAAFAQDSPANGVFCCGKLRFGLVLYSEPHKSWPPFSEAGGFLRCQVGNALRPPPLACRENMVATISRQARGGGRRALPTWQRRNPPASLKGGHDLCGSLYSNGTSRAAPNPSGPTRAKAAFHLVSRQSAQTCDVRKRLPFSIGVIPLLQRHFA